MHAWPTISSILLIMGCTSSAPNMADIHTNRTEDTETSNAKTIEKMLRETPKRINLDKVSNTFEVLPTCDSLDENLQLARKGSSKCVLNQQIEEDDRKNCSFNNEYEISTIDTAMNDDKFSSLKDVVEQVILDNILENVPNTTSDTVNKIDVDENMIPDKVVEETIDIKNNENEDLNEIIQEKEEIIEESASPSQSECSRATRWEALADIAAELPASLAVDPLTGQIYSLTK